MQHVGAQSVVGEHIRDHLNCVLGKEVCRKLLLQSKSLNPRRIVTKIGNISYLHLQISVECCGKGSWFGEQ